MGIDLTNVDRLEERKDVAADNEKGKALMLAKEQALEPLCAEHQKAIDEMEARHEEERAALDALFDPRIDEMSKPFDEALRAWGETSWPDDVVIDGDGFATVCAASGLAILDGDEIITDDETGDVYLRAALGLPPLPTEDDEDEADDVAA